MKKKEEFSTKFKSNMDSEHHRHDLDLIHVVRNINKEEKIKYINKFLSKKDNLHYNIKFLCATSNVGNAVIDYPNVPVVYHFDLDPSLLNTTQEKFRHWKQHSL